MTNNFEKIQPTLVERTEKISQDIFVMADQAKNKELSKTFNDAGAAVNEGNFDKAQSLLEDSNTWNDQTRRLAAEINNLDIERTGNQPVAIEDTKKMILSYAQEFKEISKMSNDPRDSQAAIEIESIVKDLDKSGQEGLRAVENTLKYIENTLKSKANIRAFVRKEEMHSFIKDLLEKRNIRNSLLLEKQRRKEEVALEKDNEVPTTEQRSLAAKSLEGLYARIDVPEETPSRQEILKRIETMGMEQLPYLNEELRRITNEFQRTQNAENLDSQLLELRNKKFTKDGMEEAEENRNRENLAAIRQEIKNRNEDNSTNAGKNPAKEKPQTMYSFPKDEREQVRYGYEHFGRFTTLPLEEFHKRFAEQDMEHLKNFIVQKIETSIEYRKTNNVLGRYPDTIASVLGNLGPLIDILQRIVVTQEKHYVNLDEIVRMPFAKASQQYLGLNIEEVIPDYFQNFSKRS